MKPEPPDDVIESARFLEFCSGRLLYLKCNAENILSNQVIYFQSPQIKFNRIYDLRRFSPFCVPQGKNAICVEFTCTQNDDTWHATDDELYNYTIDILDGCGILTTELVEGYFTEKLSHTYPRFRVGFQDKLKTIFDYLSQFNNIVTLGRQGLFCYANMDEVLSMSFRAIEFFNTLDYKGIDYYSLFQEYIQHD